MAWVKLDDAMPHHPKVMAAGPQAFALDVAGICYSNKHALDGMIPDSALPAVLPGLSSPRKWARKLVEVGRWTETDGGWLIHDIADYQPSATEQKELSKKRAAAGRKGGKASGKSRQTDSKPEASTKQVASTESNPDPTRPDPKATSASDGFTAFHAQRAVDAVRERKRKGLEVKSEGGLARTIQQDPDFRAESERIWAHRDCSECGGKAFVSEYSPGAGMRQVECTTSQTGDERT